MTQTNKRPGARLGKAKMEEVLRSWNTRADALGSLPLKQVEQLFEHELSHGRRRHLLLRLHTRMWRMRTVADKNALIKRLDS